MYFKCLLLLVKKVTNYKGALKIQRLLSAAISILTATVLTTAASGSLEKTWVLEY